MKLISQYPFFSGARTLSLYQFENGLRVLLLPDATAPVVAYQTWFRVGSRHEQVGKTGIAHLFEHLMFNESEHLQHGEFDRLIESKGGHTNAATWVDWTYYQTDIPKDELPLVARLEAERMARLVLKEPQLESEREVVINERRFRVEDDIDGFLSEELFRIAFQKHPYHWPTIGFMEDIRAITLEDARAFYRTYYAPNQATLVIVGDIQTEETLALIQTHYGAMQAQKIPQETTQPEPLQTEQRRQQYVKPVQTAQLVMGYKGPAFQDPHHLSLHVLSDILLGGLSSRLYRRLIIDKQLASSAHASLTPFRDPGLFQIRVALRKQAALQEVEQEITQAVQSMVIQGPTEEEVQRSQARFATGFYQGLRTAHGKAESLGEHEIIAGDYRQLFESMQTLHQLTPQDIQQAASIYLQPQQCTVLFAIPA